MSKRKSLAESITPAAEAFVSGTSKQDSMKASKQESTKQQMEIVSTRLPADLARRLRLAAGTRAADRVVPYKHQDIVAEAVAAWLKANGY